MKEKKEPKIFAYNCFELIKLKQLKQDELRKINCDLIAVEHRIVVKETDLLLNTNFRELGLTNEKMRTAYIEQETRSLRNDKKLLKMEIQEYKDCLVIINDLIKLRLAEMGGEK